MSGCSQQDLSVTLFHSAEMSPEHSSLQSELTEGNHQEFGSTLSPKSLVNYLLCFKKGVLGAKKDKEVHPNPLI